MLDKSIAYRNVIMVLPAARIAAAGPPRLPEGYRFRFYQPGDEAHWARIEASVLEFDTEAQALTYFAKTFSPYPEALAQRCCFVTDPDGVPVATATAWYEQSVPGDRLGLLHWVSVTPDRQGRGLGRAVVQRALQAMAVLEPGREVCLHTQTWSHKAIRLYWELGFRLVRGESLLRPNEWEAALETLRPVADPAFLRALEETAVEGLAPVLAENVLEAPDYAALRRQVGWAALPETQVRRALAASACTVGAWVGGRPAAMGRLVGDGLYYVLLDVVVAPEFQGQGLGTEVVRRLLDRAERETPPGGRTSVQLIAEPGKEGFYERLGFRRIPGGGCGAGMRRVIRK